MIQLKLKTEYSFGRTYAPIPKLVERLKELKVTHAGIVDDNTWGHVAFVKECEEANIKPLLGIEIVVSDDETPTRMWFLAKDKDGLKGLYRIISKSFATPVKTRFGSINRLYTSDIENMGDNILKFAGDVIDGEFLKRIGAYVDINPSSRILNAKKLFLAKEYKLPIVDTSDNSYIRESDLPTFEVISRGGLKPTPQYILTKFEYQKEAKKIAMMCGKLKLPKAPMIHEDGDLEKLCRKGIKYRKMKWNDKYEERLKYELDLIKLKKYESYFIVVADMVEYAKKYMLVGPSRGSAAGSLVCYLSRITEVDPVPTGLYFERFIDITRVDLPDIDLDFPDDKRYMVFDYMAKKYGKDNVAKIGTITKFKPKSALIQVCKAMNIPPSASGGVKAAMIERSSADARANNCLEDTFKDTTVGQKFISDYPNAIIAQLLENHASHTGVHAAGLLISNEEITNYATVDNNGIAHVEKKAVEKLGLLKIDVLGLRTLSVLSDIDADIDWYNLKFDDQKTFDVFNSNRLCGIFQFDGQAMRSIAEQIEIKSIDEIDAVTALARPGPFATGVTEKYIKRFNGDTYQPIHPLVEPFMDKTFGLPIYQEQVIAIGREIGLFNWEQLAQLRKGMSKSLGVEFFNKYRDLFLKGASKNGIPQEYAIRIWELINAMGSWAMNKAHTYSYAVISYWTAYLKANYPLEFAAATLRNSRDEDHSVALLKEFEKEGYEYIPFDIELSEKNWCVKDNKLIGGFTSLKGIGDSKADKLIEARNNNALTEKQLKTLRESTSVFFDLNPIKTKYAKMYATPSDFNVFCDINYIEDFNKVPSHGHERVFIAELLHKSPRNANEDAEIKKRDGKVETGQLEFLDVRLRDDTGTIGGRIGRYDYLRIGRSLMENVAVGKHLLIRCKFYNNIRYAFIKKWKVLDDCN